MSVIFMYNVYLHVYFPASYAIRDLDTSTMRYEFSSTNAPSWLEIQLWKKKRRTWFVFLLKLNSNDLMWRWFHFIDSEGLQFIVDKESVEQVIFKKDWDVQV